MNTYVPTTKYKNILIVESNIAFAERLAIALIKEGYKTNIIRNGSEAFKVIAATKPDLIVLDMILTGTDGYEILLQKQASPGILSIPVFFLSTQGVPINMRLIPEGSVTEFSVSMQPDPGDIVFRINRLFGQPDATGATSAPQAPEEVKKKKVLWVEDDKLIGNILGKKIMASGYELHHSTNGQDALKAVENFTPDAIVLDLMLPGMNGFEILQKFKANPKLNKIPVMILSNLSKPSDIEKAKMMGVKKFFVKAAMSLDQIIEQIEDMVR